MRKFLSSVLATAIMPVSASAQDTSGNVEIYAETANWRVLRDRTGCTLVKRPLAGAPLLTLHRADGPRINLLIELPPSYDLEDHEWSLEMVMNSYSERLGLSDGGTRLQVMGLGQDFAAAFIRSYTLDVVSAATTHFSIDLAGTSVAFGAFDRCANGLPMPRTAHSLPPTYSRPLIPEPDLTPPLPPSRAVAPIRPASWFSGYDLPMHPTEGRVGFRVRVTAQGRAEDCEVLESTTDRRLEALTCQLITRRARFDPASDAEGNPIAAIWTSSVAWRLPD